MNKQKELKRLALAAVLTAMSIAIDVFFKRVLGLHNFGVPFYAIPIVFGSILLGPIYGILMSLVGDAFGVLIAGFTYLPFFMIAPIMWGLIPGLLMRKKISHLGRLAIALFLTYILVSLSNTFAIYYYYGEASAMATLYVRISLIPFNTILMFFILKELNRKLLPVSTHFMNPELKTEKS